MNKLTLCGAFHALPTKSPSNKSSKSHDTEETTVFTFQLSRGGTGAVDSHSYQSSCSESPESKGTKSSRSRELKSKSSKDSKRQKRNNAVDEYRNVRKALFDAATESESIATDPLLGMVVSKSSREQGSKMSGSGTRKKKIDRADSKSDCRDAAAATLNTSQDKSVQITSGSNKDDIGEDIPDKRQLLWHAAMQYHRSRHGRYKQGKQTSRKRHGDRHNKHNKTSRKKQLQELDVLINSSKESLNTNIRKRGLKNIHQYLPSLSDTDSTSQQQLEHPISNSRQPIETNDVLKQHTQTNVPEEYCPICSCRLTILYSSPTTHRLTEIHSGCDTPSSKMDKALPPYCIGCRAYLVYESWDEVKRRQLLRNFEQRLELYSPSSSGSSGMDSCPLEDFRNGRLIVVASSSGGSCDHHGCATPKISNSSSEVSSFSRDSFEVDVVPKMFTASSLSNSHHRGLPEHYGEDGKVLIPTSQYRRKGTIMFDSYDGRSEVERRRNDGLAANPDGAGRKQQKVEVNDDTISDASTIGSEDDPFEDLKTPKNGEMPATKNEALDAPDDTPGADSNATLAPPKTNATTGEIQTPSKHNDSQNHPSYKEIDEIITFKSPTLAAKQSMIQAQVAIASTFSEEFAIFNDYNIKKAAATKQIAKCLQRGYELTAVKCDRCEMPLMKRGEEEICVSCPAIMKRVRKIVKEKRTGLKTPKMSNRTEFNDFEQVDTRDDEASFEIAGSEVHMNALVEPSREAAPQMIQANESCSSVYVNLSYNATTTEIEEMEGGIAGQSRAIPAGCSDYWVVHSASQVSNEQKQQANNVQWHQTNYHRTRLYDHVMPPQSNFHHQQPTHSQNQQKHDPNTYQFQSENLHQSSYHHSSEYHQNTDNSQQVCHHHEPAHYYHPSHANGFHGQHHIRLQPPYKHNSDNTGSFQPMPHPQPSNDYNFGTNENQQQSIQQQPSYHELNATSCESGYESFHHIVNGESLESVTKCPRDLPPTGLIWEYKPSERHPNNGGMLSSEMQGAHDAHSHCMQHESTCPVPANANMNPMQSSSRSYQIGSHERKAFDSVATPLQSDSSHKTESATRLALSPRQDKFKQIWNECVPVSFELNSDAKRKVIDSDSKLFENESSGAFGRNRQFDDNAAMMPGKSIYRENVMSPSTITTTPHLSIEEGRFCERLKQIANKLKSTADEFAYNEKDNRDELHTPLPMNGHSNTTHSMMLGSSSPALQNDTSDRTQHETRSSSPVLIRKPLEPMGIESDNCQLSVHSRVSAVVQEARQSDVHMRTSGTDPPGREPSENAVVVGHHLLRVSGNIRSPKGHIRSPHAKESITPRRSVVDPPEDVGAYPKSKGTESVQHCTPQRKNGYLRRPTITTPTNRSKNRTEVLSPRSSMTMSQSKLSHLRTPKSRTSSVSYERHSTTSKSAFDTKKPTKSEFHLNIPSWVDDEIDTPIKAAKSFGETSMDQLMRKIDEIENDFSTIVASLPGSDGLTLRFTKSDDNSTLASKTTFDMQEEADNIEHQLKSSSFESQESQDRLISGILQQMRIVQDQIQQLDSCDMDDGSGSERSQGSQGMAELLGRLAHAAESLRSLQME
ncbi:hypothetical protein ACHAWO_005745 [Cyclotella atomus]|uniref:Uncharacterized protein n=1 Tax=Cyclotella atomus TaxID=382360 RepID=A0ABD3PC65_9STRA